MVVSISGVVQNPNTYAISGLTLTFSAAPPTGTNNIGVLYLGIPATSVTTPGNTAYLSSTEFTATAGQTTFTPSGTYQVGFINVIRNGAQLAPSDYTATNGTTVVLGTACTLGDSVVIQVYNLVSVANALPSTGGTVTGATTFSSTATINGGSASGYTGYKNRIINGAMVIDQRNNGASITAVDSGYSLDRWLTGSNQVSKFSVQRNAGSVTPPAGFVNYLGVTSLSAYTPVTIDSFSIQQRIEGFNTLDFNYGTASAVTSTLSFWVRSSLTGTFGGQIFSSASRSYPFTYSIPVANTWTYITITFVGDTVAALNQSNSYGLIVVFGLGSVGGGTVNTWQNGNYTQPAGCVNVVSTNGATWYVTGVQLERGSNATSFEFRDYGRELIMCQRYLPAISGGGNYLGFGTGASTTLAYMTYTFPVQPRVAPTGITVSSASHFNVTDIVAANSPALTIGFANAGLQTALISATLASGITSARPTSLVSTSASAQILWTGCEL
jgi:hypothetical protein